MKEYWGMEVKLHSLLTSAFSASGWFTVFFPVRIEQEAVYAPQTLDAEPLCDVLLSLAIVWNSSIPVPQFRKVFVDFISESF